MSVFNEQVILYDKNENSSEFYLSSMGILYPDKNYVIAREEFNSNIIEYIVEGVGYIEVDGIISKVKAGDCCCLRKGYSHKYYSDESLPYKKIWINVSGTLIDSWLNLYDVTLTPYIKSINVLPEFDRLKSYIENGTSSEKIILLIHDIIFRLSRAPVQYNALNVTEETHCKDRRKFILDVKKYIEKSAIKPLSIDELSNVFSISKSQLMRLFKKQYGITPYAYALECRLQIAGTLLKTSDLSIDEIASKLCFCDRNHFSKAFVKYYKMSPSAYRRSLFNK